MKAKTGIMLVSVVRKKFCVIYEIGGLNIGKLPEKSNWSNRIEI